MSCIETTSNFQRDLSNIVRMGTDPNRTIQDILKGWYTKGGGSYFFLFRKNAHVTDISFSELISLIRIHATDKINSEKRPNLQFRSSSIFKNTLHSLWESFGTSSTPDEVRRKWEFIVKEYFSFFSKTILVDPYFCSAVVHVPATLDIESKMHLICAEAGYIHSCGDAIYVRNARKSEKDKFITKVADFINEQDQQNPGRITFFSTYSREQFTKYEQANDEAEFRNGLNDVKIDLDKFYLEDTPLFDVLRELRDRVKDKIFIPPGNESYKTERVNFKSENSENANKETTLWLLIDKSLSADVRVAGNGRYFVCYAQRYANRNPFISFDEHKPGWIAPTTLPHTLAAAMLNVTRPYIDDQSVKENSKTINVIDPFVGGGTTFLEVLKLDLNKNIFFVASDIQPMSKIIIEDNFHFFSLSEQEVVAKYQELKELLDNVDAGRDRSTFRYVTHTSTIPMPAILCPSTGLPSLIKWALTVFALEFPEIQADRSLQDLRKLNSHKFSQKFIDCFNVQEEYFWSRIVFYMVWRAVLKNMYKIGAGIEEIGNAVRQEVQKFCYELEKLKNIRKETPFPGSSESSRVRVCEGLYSRVCTIPETLLTEEMKNIKEQKHKILAGEEDGDVNTVLKNYCDKFDLVITDPPYGFNTDCESATELASLYSELIRNMIRALKDNGQIIFCLPKESYNGQNISYFSTKEMVVRDLLFKASESDMEVVQLGNVNPSPSELFRPPYYWQSDRALTRTILHFQLRKKGDVG